MAITFDDEQSAIKLMLRQRWRACVQLRKKVLKFFYCLVHFLKIDVNTADNAM